VTSLRSREPDVVRAGGRSSARRFLLWLCLAVTVARSAYAVQPLRSDEGGYLLIARHWRAGGEFLYGDYHVDRPPLLLLLFRVAALSEWDGMIRVLTIPFALLFVLAAWHVGRRLSEGSGGRWAALVAAGLMCSPALAADQADGELFAAPLVMAALALSLAAWQAFDERVRLGLAFAAGLLAGAAPLVKQSFLEGAVFILVLVVATWWERRRIGRRELTFGLAALAGGALPHAVVVTWAAAGGVGPSRLWQDLAGFRGAAFGVIWASRPGASIERATHLVALGLISGLLLVLATWLAATRPWRLRLTPEQWGLMAVLAFGAAAIVAGGSYWPHYLLQLAVGAAAAAGAVAPLLTRAGRWMRGAARMVVGAAVAGTVAMAAIYASTPWVWFQERTGRWLAESAASGDTAVVVYGNPSVLEAADLPSPYPYLWSLPMRTLDRDQARLRSTLGGPDAPSWIVQVSGFDAWGIDVDSRLRHLVERRYRQVAEVCGNPVWLRQDLERRLAPSPRC
jgi:4-amino-4-deoxy-L-arabinose transferase-like glycosyltransferase